MAATLTSTYANYLKKAFSMPENTAQVTKATPTLKMLPRDSSKLGWGESFYITVKTHEAYSLYTNWQYGSGANYKASASERFLIDTPVTSYAQIDLDNLFLARNKSDGKLLDVAKAEVKEVNKNYASMLEREFWAPTQYAYLGQVVTAGTGDAATNLAIVVDAMAIYNIDVGMKVSFTDNNAGAGDGTGTARSTAGVCTVVAKDVGASTITINAVGDPDEIDAGDYIHLVGHPTSTAANNVRNKGFRSWIPDSVASDTFLGVVRTNKGESVQGWRFAFQGTIEETIKNALTQMGKHVAQDLRNFYVCLSAGDWYLLEQELGQRVVRDPAATQTVGTEVISVRSPFGLVKCMVIPVLTDGRCYGVDFSSWTLHHIGGIPHIVNEDGQDWRLLGRGAADAALVGDGIQMVTRAWTQFTCHAPIRNFNAATA